jgi:hypothetical protein
MRVISHMHPIFLDPRRHLWEFSISRYMRENEHGVLRRIRGILGVGQGGGAGGQSGSLDKHSLYV